MIQPDAYYTTDEVAIELRIERRNVRAAIASGEIPALDVGGGQTPRWRLLGSDVLAWARGRAEARRTGHTGAPTNG